MQRNEGRPDVRVPVLRRGAARAAAGLAMLLLALPLAGCRPPRRAPPLALPIPRDEPAEFFDLARAGRGEAVARYDLGRPEGLAPWRVTANAGSPGRDRDGVTFLAPRPGGRLEAGFEIAAAEVDALEAEVVGLTGAGFVEISWQMPDDPSARASQLVTARDLGAGGADPVRFLLRSNPNWRGGIRSLALAIANPAARATRVRSITLLRLSARDGTAGPELGRACRIEIDHEVRSGFPLARDGELLLLDGVPGPGRLRLGVALTAPAAGRLVVVLRRRDPGGRPAGEEVLDAIAVPAEPGHWQDSVVRVSGAPPGSTATLIVRAELESPFRPAVVVGGIRFEPDPPPDAAAAPDVLVISIDTLRADRMSLYGSPRPTSPRLEAWARQATAIFDDAVAPAPSTLPSHASLFTGREVLHHGAFLDVPLRAGFATLAGVFRAGGWETVAVTGGGFLHPFYGLHQGFDRYRYWPRRPDRNDLDLGDGVRRALELLAQPDRGPRFVFLHTYDVHAPYRAHEPYLAEWRAATEVASAQPLEQRGEGGRVATRIRRWPVVQTAAGATRPLREDEAALVGDLYDSGVAAMDATLAPLLRFVSSPERRDRTLVVFLSDHGESLGEQGRWEHGYLDQTNLRVPLVLQLPEGGRDGRRVGGPASLVDLLPTLAASCGLAVPAAVDGAALADRRGALAARPGAPVVSYSGELNEGLAVRRGALKWVLSDSLFESDGLARVFDLERDPGELAPALPARVEGAAELDRAGRRRLTEERAGTLVALENGERGAVRVVLRGPGVRWNTVKWAGGERPVAQLRDDGAVEIALAPGAATRLRLHDRAASGAFTIDLTSGAGVDEEVRVASAAARGVVAPVAGGPEPAQRQIARSSRLAVAVRVWDAHARPASGGAPAEPPSEAERQLRALGYLD